MYNASNSTAKGKSENNILCIVRHSVLLKMRKYQQGYLKTNAYTEYMVKPWKVRKGYQKGFL